MLAQLVWSPGFGPERNKQFMTAQKFVDSEVLRLSAPYTPMKTGMLIKSGTLGTVIGSGVVQWIAPYARAQYYRPGRIGGSGTDSVKAPLRGPRWFERMKSKYGAQIIAGAKKIAGGRR